ncbi:hypothetical protein [Lyticum sinuosum]|uniref:Uncharacterized protein n=1 Tax=Lyticum sinuosum TaxID=1332059 RepID=A0AAE5AH75_9RICK|nr:hypothetical protein [Lyticum sinuosum]MDZ5761250.1 hypothetical protein [Lyticum sinuosum]
MSLRIKNKVLKHRKIQRVFHNTRKNRFIYNREHNKLYNNSDKISDKINNIIRISIAQEIKKIGLDYMYTHSSNVMNSGRIDSNVFNQYQEYNISKYSKKRFMSNIFHKLISEPDIKYQNIKNNKNISDYFGMSVRQVGMSILQKIISLE